MASRFKMSDFQKCKLDNCFRSMDTDQDGCLTQMDFKCMADRLCKQGNFSEARSKQLHCRMMKCFNTYFKSHCRGTPATCETFLNRVMACDEHTMKDDITFFYDCMFDALDADNDGKISEKEFHGYYKMLGKGQHEMLSKDTFKMMDTDGDGHVSKEEFCRAGCDFFCRDKDESCSDHMWGPVKKFSKRMGCSAGPELKEDPGLSDSDCVIS